MDYANRGANRRRARFHVLFKRAKLPMKARLIAVEFAMNLAESKGLPQIAFID
jgi:hypothetical protein